MSEISTMKVAELRKMAEEQNLPGWEDMSKAELITALSSASQPADQQPAEPAAPEPKLGTSKYPKPSKFTGFVEISPGVHEMVPAVGSKAETMKQKLMAQSTTRIIVPLEAGEKVGRSTKAVTLNGYVVHIEKGTYVEVPNQIADVIMDSEKQTQAAMNTDTKIDDGGQGKDLGTL